MCKTTSKTQVAVLDAGMYDATAVLVPPFA